MRKLNILYYYILNYINNKIYNNINEFIRC